MQTAMADEVNYDELADLLASHDVVNDPLTEVSAATPRGETESNSDSGVVKSEDRRKKEKRHKREKRSKKHKKRLRVESSAADNSSDDEGQRRKSKYVLDAAESGDSDDEDGTDDDFVEDEEVSEIDYSDRQKPYLFHEGDEGKSVDELAKYYEDADRHYQEHGEDDDMLLSANDLSSRRLISQFLPKEDDPKVFSVKCRPRMARVLVTRVVNKCYAYRVGNNYERKKVDLGIISVFALDHVKEYFYVEASRKRFVENVLRGLDGVFNFGISVVDPKELLQTMETRASTQKIRMGDFVRLRQGFYRNDLAQVTSVHADGIHITCKVVPREDFVQKRYNKATKRLPPRFFAPQLALYVRKTQDVYVWGDLRFDQDGYLVKVVSIRMAISGSQMVPPSTEELARFYNNDRERVERAIKAAEAVSQVVPISIGDSVRVTSGQLRNTIGTVVNIFTNTNTVALSCAAPGRAEPIKVQVEVSACAKHFAEGTHVVVERGEHAGESGTVVKSWGPIVLLFPDRAAVGAELKVEANDCHQSKLSSLSLHQSGGWQLFDLVSVAELNCIGCIVRLNRNDVDVLTQNNDVRNLTYAQVKAVGRDTRQTVDRRKNVLSRGVEVRIERSESTPVGLEGQSGRIEHIFNRTLFVRCPASPQQANMIALDADCVLLIGGRKTTRRAQTSVQGPLLTNTAVNAVGAARMSVLHSRESELWDESSVIDANVF